jgi:hypothetical protein
LTSITHSPFKGKGIITTKQTTCTTIITTTKKTTPAKKKTTTKKPGSASALEAFMPTAHGIVNSLPPANRTMVAIGLGMAYIAGSKDGRASAARMMRLK